MSEHVNEPHDHLTEGWPSEPDNPELAQFAEKLRAAQPELPPDSLDRVEQRMKDERTALARRMQKRRIFMGAGLAAAVVLSVGIYAFLPRQRPDAPGASPVTLRPVHDVYRVDFTAPPAPRPPQRPLVRVEEYQSLFSD